MLLQLLLLFCAGITPGIYSAATNELVAPEQAASPYTLSEQARLELVKDLATHCCMGNNPKELMEFFAVDAELFNPHATYRQKLHQLFYPDGPWYKPGNCLMKCGTELTACGCCKSICLSLCCAATPPCILGLCMCAGCLTPIAPVPYLFIGTSNINILVPISAATICMTSALACAKEKSGYSCAESCDYACLDYFSKPAHWDIE